MPVTVNQPVAQTATPQVVPVNPGSTVIQPPALPVRVAGTTPVNSKGADYKIVHNRVGGFTMGDLINIAKDLPGADIPWLLEQGAIAAVEAGAETIAADLAKGK